MALSLGSPPLDVIQHPDPVEPGLSSDLMSDQQLSGCLPVLFCDTAVP